MSAGRRRVDAGASQSDFIDIASLINTNQSPFASDTSSLNISLHTVSHKKVTFIFFYRAMHIMPS